MNPRFDHLANPVGAKVMKYIVSANKVVWDSTLPATTRHLVEIRASQINGCGYCIDMHWRDLIKLDADPRHLNAVAGWREAPFFSDRERAALRWAEAVTLIPQRDPSDEDFAELKQHFTEQEIAELGFVIANITAWNLLNVSFRNPMPENA